MTGEQAAQAHPDAAQGAILVHRLEHVFRTSGAETAGRGKERRDEALVETQRGDYCLAHFFPSRSNSRRSSSGDAFKAARRGLMTISHCCDISAKRSRSASLIRLFARFRSTAFPKARGRVNPSLGPSSAARGTRRQNAAKYGPAIRSPWLYALRKSEVLRMRALFGKPNLVGVPQGSFVANREFMPAPCASPRGHGPPVLCSHSYPQSVGLGPFAGVWLKCAL